MTKVNEAIQEYFKQAAIAAKEKGEARQINVACDENAKELARDENPSALGVFFKLSLKKIEVLHKDGNTANLVDVPTWLVIPKIAGVGLFNYQTGTFMKGVCMIEYKDDDGSDKVFYISSTGGPPQNDFDIMVEGMKKAGCFTLVEREGWESGSLWKLN